jgi:C1A family cysteine protease
MPRAQVRKRIVRRKKDGKAFSVSGMKAEGGLPPPMKSSPFQASRAVGELPARVDLRQYCTPVEDQSQSNSCCANAAAGAYEYLCKRVALENGDDVGDISRLFIYFVGRKSDQVRQGNSALVKDEGMTLSGAANALEAQGACLENTWPFELRQVNDRPPPEAFDEASNYKITEVKMIPTDLTAMKQCLAEGYPIVFGCKLTQPFFDCPGGIVATPDPNDPQSAEHGRHAMLIVGYSDSNETFIVRNSWGEQWGDQGYCYMPYDYIGNSEFNMGGMWSARGLTDYDFTPEPKDDSQDLFDPSKIDEQPALVEIESEDEDLGEPEEDPQADQDATLFDPNFIFKMMFDKFDTDKSGTVSKDECKALLAKLGVPWFAASAAFSMIDKDGSGTLSQDEFIAAFGSLLGLAMKK